MLVSIGLDHTEFLGDSIEEITKDKCGIIKPKSVVITNKENKGLKWIKELSNPIIVSKYF